MTSSNYQHLYVLGLNSNLITDISFLTNLTNLERLNLGDNPITDFSPLENFKKLSRLEIDYNQYINNKSLFDKLESAGIEIFVR